MHLEFGANIISIYIFNTLPHWKPLHANGVAHFEILHLPEY